MEEYGICTQGTSESVVFPARREKQTNNWVTREHILKYVMNLHMHKFYRRFRTGFFVRGGGIFTETFPHKGASGIPNRNCDL